MSIKRFDFGTEYRGNTGVPGIVGKADGRYVLYEDYAAAVAHNEYLLARLRKSDAQLAAIEAYVLQSPEIQALRKDAERYRWLRQMVFDDRIIVDPDRMLSGESLDSAIDAAMEQQT